MTALTLTLNGLEEDDIADFRRVFGKLRGSLEADWRLTDDADASLRVIDIDSIYGHMDWLKAVGSGERAAVYTSAQYARETELCLFKPLAADNLADVLNAVSAELGVQRAVAAARPPARTEDAAPAPAARVTETAAASVVPSVVAKPPPSPVATPVPPAPAPAPAPVVERDSEPEAAATVEDAPVTIGEALRKGSIAAPVRITVGEEAWVIDPEREAYHGTEKLKPLAEALGQGLDALGPVDVIALETARRSPAQPLARLRWFAGLMVTPGRLHDGLASDSRYMLSRWPQIEREFPRHFRIATAMMKQPGTLSEIATACGVPEPDVADFINAGDAIGIVQISGDRLEASEVSRGGVMSRIRRPFGR